MIVGQPNGRKREEQYTRMAGTTPENCFPSHSYRRYNFLLLPLAISLKQTHVKCLAHGTYQLAVEDCVLLEDSHVALSIRDEVMKTIEKCNVYRGIAQHQNSIREEGGLAANHSLFKNTFKCCELHVQTNHELVTSYPPHFDKVGNLVCFVPLNGYSFVFLGTPSRFSYKTPKVHGGCKKYKRWKDRLGNSDLRKLGIFIKDVADETKRRLRSNLFQIKVYYMSPGSFVTFPAADIVHGSVIPKQESPRTIVIFHDLIPAK